MKQLGLCGIRRFLRHGSSQRWKLNPLEVASVHPATRSFSSTPYTLLRTTELQSSHFASLKCQPDRLWSTIHDTSSQFGPGRRYGEGPEQTGLSRLALTDADKEARDWFVDTTKSLGCKVTIDSIGNIFAIRPGLNNDAPATFVGSHLDSQPLGGRFDGVLGICAGVEMLKVLNDNWIETEGRVGVVNWTNEEGARFPISMMGSGVYVGVRSLEEIYDLREISAGEGMKSCTVKEELERIGYLGSIPAHIDEGGMKMAGHFELHIEQGPRLLKMSKSVGAVTGAQAYKWFNVHVKGRACHTGTTPMADRTDPLLFAVKVIRRTSQLAKQHHVLASTGVVKVEPGSVNTVPESVVFTVDIRAETDEKLQEFVQLWKSTVQDRLSKHVEAMVTHGIQKLEAEITETFSSAAAHFDDVAIGFVEESARSILGDQEVPRMVSGAGHDSVNTAKHCPTAMVFVPCKDGVSHHPEEWCSKDHCAVGANVIVQSVLRFDQWRHQEGHFAG